MSKGLVKNIVLGIVAAGAAVLTAFLIFTLIGFVVDRRTADEGPIIPPEHYVSTEFLLQEFNTDTHYNSIVTKAQFARLVIEATEEAAPEYTRIIFYDVPYYSWANPWITAAVFRGIILPAFYENVLDANSPITQQEAAAWMVRALGIEAHDEAVAAVGIGIIDRGRFEPFGTVRLSDAAVLITEMARVMDALRPVPPEINNTAYAAGVTVIPAPPAYSLTEADGWVSITVYNADEEVAALNIGDTFVFEPTLRNPSGISGHIEDIVSFGTEMIIIAAIPDSLDEIFSGFEFSSNINLLETAGEIILSDELRGLSGAEILRNDTGFTLRLTDVNVTGVNLNGEFTLISPALSLSFAEGSVGHLTMSAGARLDIAASSQFPFDRVIPLYTIPVFVSGLMIEVPVGLRISSAEPFSLVFECTAEMNFGISGYRPFAQVKFDYMYDYEQAESISVSLNFQVRSHILMIPAYGLSGDIGRGFQSAREFHQRCPAGECVTLGSFPIRRLTSIQSHGQSRGENWGVLGDNEYLRFGINPAQSTGSVRSLSNGVWHRVCPHRAFNERLTARDMLHPSEFAGRNTVAAGANHALAIDNNGILWAWGDNSDGQLGVVLEPPELENDAYEQDERHHRGFDAAQSSVPVPVMSNAVAVAAHGNRSMALRADGSLWAWGNNANGGLGDGTSVNRGTPVLIMDNIAAISADYYRAMATTTGGSLYEWGARSRSPRRVMTNVLSASAAGPMVIRYDGSLWAWGINPLGLTAGLWRQMLEEEIISEQDFTNNSPSRPLHVMEDVISAGDGTWAIRYDNSLWAWGRLASGLIPALGMREEIPYAAVLLGHVPVLLMEDVSAVSYSQGGLGHAMFITTDGSLLAWGDNRDGQLGHAAAGPDAPPVLIMENMAAVSTGSAFTLALAQDGTLYAFGDNRSGQLGDGTTTTRRTPVRVMGNVMIP